MRWPVSATTLHETHIASDTFWADGVFEADSTVVAVVIGLVVVAAVVYLFRRSGAGKGGGH